MSAAAAAMRCIFQRLVRSPPIPVQPLLLHSSWCAYFSSQTESDHLQLLSSAGRQGNNLRLGSCIHASLIKTPPYFHGHIRIYNSLLHIYCKSGELCDAVKLFDEMPLRDTVSWNSLISGFLKLGELQLGFEYFKLLLNSSIYQFDHASLTSVLSACGGSLEMVKMIHALAVLNGYEKEITVGNSLTTMYFRCRAFGSGMRVFYEMVERNVVTWTAVISGLAQNEFYAESLNLFVEMYCCGRVSPNCLTYLNALSACSGLQALKEGAQIHGVILKYGFQSDLCVGTALMDMYSKCGYVGDAWRIFESAEVIDEVCITVILVGFAQNGFEKEALQMFVKMVKAGTSIDPNMISAILGVFDINTFQGLGVQIHSLVIKKGFACNVYVCNGLINTYSKRGELEESVKVFDLMPKKNQVSWNSMIAAFARHGDGLKALQFYEEMILKGVKPTDVTFLSLLHACSHVGLLHEGMELLQLMEKAYGMRPRMEHYACVVDMFGRAGLLKEAKEFIVGLPVKPDVLVWQALLGACSIYNDVDMGKYAADQLAEAAPDSPVPFISMANIYSSRGRWRERAATMKKMKEKGVAKETGASWIEIEKKMHSFVVADRMHPRVGDVYVMLLKLFGHMRDEGSVPDMIFTSFS